MYKVFKQYLNIRNFLKGELNVWFWKVLDKPMYIWKIVIKQNIYVRRNILHFRF